jgi:hypothetical protein
MGSTSPAQWRTLLAEPGEHSHAVQLYRDHEFYEEAIAHFAAEGVVRGESIILAATGRNLERLCARLRGKGLELDALVRHGQLALLDADQTLPKFMVGAVPDGDKFKALGHEAIERARANGKFKRVRWWGEMVNVLSERGNQAAAHQLEQHLTEIGHETPVSIFCSYSMDPFDRAIYGGAFQDVCATHSLVIPTDDYARHREAVNRAIHECVGDVRASLLDSMARWRDATAERMPSSQAMLLWIKDRRPQHFDAVISRARTHHDLLSGSPS